MEPNDVRISEITGTRENPVIKAVIPEEGSLEGHVLKDFTLPEFSEFIRSSHILGAESDEIDPKGRAVLTPLSHDEYLASVREQVDLLFVREQLNHLFKSAQGFRSVDEGGVWRRTLHIKKKLQRGDVLPTFAHFLSSRAPLPPTVSTAGSRVASQIGVRSGIPFGTHLGERLLPSSEGPDGYYIVNLASPRRPPPSVVDTMLGYGLDKNSYRHAAQEGDLLVEPQQVRKQYPIRLLSPPDGAWQLDALGITQHGKHVIQQQALRSCVPATVAMLLLDKGKIPNYIELRSMNLSNDEGIFASLRQAECEGIRCDLSGGNFLEKAEQAIRLRGPIMLGIHHPTLAGHEIILDSVDVHRNEVTIRDPYYGAMLTIPAEVFFSWDPGKGIQIL